MTDALTSINLFSFPLNAVLVDDDPDLLDLAYFQFHTMHNMCKFHSPAEAINKIVPIKINMKMFISSLFDGIFDINFKNIKQFVDSCQAKDGIIISDYSMPNIDGIQLVEKYQEYDIIKILLTNAYSCDEAVRALQNDTIDYYLPKNHLAHVANIVEQLQYKYFNKITRNILGLLDVGHYEFLFDNGFIEIFKKICKILEIKKYYILNSYGNYYLESDTNKYIFTVYSLANLHDIINEIPKSYRKTVLDGNLIPSYFSSEYSGDLLVTATKSNNYSYAIEKISDKWLYSDTSVAQIQFTERLNVR